MSTTSPARLAIEGAIATLTLDRPERMNAIDVEMAACLHRLAAQVAADDSVSVLVIEGAGPAFCAGGDVAMFAAQLDDLAPAIRALLAEYHEFLILLRMMPKIVLTRLHGSVAGAGLSLAFMGDVAVAAAETRFVPGYAKLGVSPDGGGTIGLSALVGGRRALAIQLLTDRFSAAEAQAWGLLAAVAPSAELDERVGSMAAKLARQSSQALAATKRLVMDETEATLRRKLDAEQEALLACMAAEPFRMAVRAFMGGTAAAPRQETSG